MSAAGSRALLAEVVKVLESPGYWTSGALARDAAGDPCGPRSPQAVCWSLDGALVRAGPADFLASAARSDWLAATELLLTAASADGYAAANPAVLNDAVARKWADGEPRFALERVPAHEALERQCQPHHESAYAEIASLVAKAMKERTR